MNFFEQFGIQPVLLLAQIVNFAILVFLLNKFLYKPILKVLEQRRQTIAESLANAEKIEKELARTELDRQKKIDQALDEAKSIIIDAKENSAHIIAEAQQKAAVEATKIIEQAKQDLTNERESLHQEIRSEIADIVVVSLEKILNKQLSSTDRQKITKEALAEIK